MTNSRYRHFIDRSVQGKLILRILVHWVFLLTATFVTLYVWQFLLSGDPQRPFSPQMRDVWSRFLPLLVVFLCLLPAFVWDTVKFSHRFVGPMFRLRSSMRALAKGESVAPIKLRRGDFWREAADDFNALLQKIRAEQTADSSDAIPVVAPAPGKGKAPEPAKQPVPPASQAAAIKANPEPPKQVAPPAAGPSPNKTRLPEPPKQAAPPAAQPAPNKTRTPEPQKQAAPPARPPVSNGIRKP